LLGEADVVVGCAEPTPRGVLRYLDWLADVARLRSSVVTVANKVPSSRVAAETSRQLGDVGGSLIDDVVEVPFDRAVAAAEWDGSLVARGPFRKSMHRVVALIDERLAERTAVTT
jgi:MinD superfamily P-loop ATPase